MVQRAEMTFFLISTCFDILVLLLLLSCHNYQNGAAFGKTFYAMTNTVQHLTVKEQSLLPALYNYKLELQKHYDSLRTILDDIYLETLGNSKNSFILQRSNLPIINTDELANEIAENPFRIFKLIERFVNIWPALQNRIEEWNLNNQKLLTTIKEIGGDVELPTKEALVEGMTSLIKLKRTYNIQMRNLVKGNLKGIETKSGLSPENCYELGRFAMRYSLFTECIDILVEGLKLIRQQTKMETGCYQATPLERDLETILKIAIERHDSKLKNGTFESTKNPFHFTRPLQSYPSKAFDSRQPRKLIPDIAVKNMTNMTGLFRAYENICDGIIFKTPKERKSLFCRLENRPASTHPYFYLQPLKLEFHHENPIVLQVHDVLTSKEITQIIAETKPRLVRSLVVGVNATNHQHFGRTSSNTFINDYEPGNRFHYISKRIEMMVGLRASILDASEDLQVANYGPGEFYGPHFDAGDFDKDLDLLVPFQQYRGDRLATFMIYLNNVTKGGSTAFPRLGISVKPKKGSGVFWYNLRHDRHQEPLSLHAGCPVLYGTKWISNKWIRANEQIFIRKCPIGLSPYKYP